jgi:hypothetical protein
MGEHGGTTAQVVTNGKHARASQSRASGGHVSAHDTTALLARRRTPMGMGEGGTATRARRSAVPAGRRALR